MKQNLILTGWSKSEYLAAAAAAFEVLKADADVAGVSMEALAGVLSGDAAKYKTVYVLGVGLTKNIGGIVAALAMLKKAHVNNYPGNVRELINILDRARALEETDFIKLIAEHKRINRDLCEIPAPAGYPDNLDLAIRQHAQSVFDKNNHNLTATKEALGISLNTLKKYLAQYHHMDNNW